MHIDYTVTSIELLNDIPLMCMGCFIVFLNPTLRVTIIDGETWKERVKEVTHCKGIKEHCTIVCLACKWDYRGKEIILQSHLVHLKVKHGGFTPSQVSGQNSFEEFIPGLVEIGAEEKDRRKMVSQSAARQLNISSRADRLAKYRNTRGVAFVTISKRQGVRSSREGCPPLAGVDFHV